MSNILGSSININNDIQNAKLLANEGIVLYTWMLQGENGAWGLL